MNRKENKTVPQTYTAPEVVEIEMSLENTILSGSGEDWEEYVD